jgi:polar amino acid transport system permease protein
MADAAVAGKSKPPVAVGVLPTTSSDELLKIFKTFAVVVLVVGIPAALFMRWDWLDPSFKEASGLYPNYGWKLIVGIGWTVFLLLASCAIGMLLAIPIGLVQVTGPRWLAAIARGFCTTIRGTPLLIQLWLLYYGLGEFLPLIPRDIWNADILFGLSGVTVKDVLVAAWPYALLAFTLSVAGYEGEIMRGAFAGVPKGELEAARAFGMSPFKVLRRVWLPRAIHQALPTLSGEVVLQLKSTPLAATVTIFDVFAVGTKVRQDLLIIYEPLLFIALVYATLTLVVVLTFRYLENLVPAKRA